ncbi:plastid delta12-fatty acid acetylenase [Artemisia annua]|uniref:Plastid delta12-fatty acid acetylenase n=1 Tax=Artemisia annua TaxID=35608 RepID=A0A2U1KEL0_ARTAN|nr:plastid delta12-fatty acid acetylenase [Artemisia annua]
MGAGGRMSDSSDDQSKDALLKRVPIEPPFTLSDLKKAIPAHCFERSVIRSSYYVVHDLIVAYVFYFLANTYIPFLPTPLAYAAWPIYWFCQASILTGLWVIGHECGHHAFSEYQLVDDMVGFVLHSFLFTPYFSWKYSHRNHHANTNSIDNDEVYIPKPSILTGLWVIGHECGHHAFSEYQLVDDMVGFVLHSFLFTPYFSWKYSHRNHHANTNSIDNDEVYIPKRKSKVRWYSKILNNPPGRVFTLVFRFTLGFPLYLLTNISGKKYGRFANHFDPLSPIFTDRERVQVLISDLGLLAVFYVIKLLVAAKGVAWVTSMYLIPALGVHVFFVIITYLHHTHLSLPHYDSTEWNWIRGALSTIDRDFGFLNRVFHDVTHTHVLHHLISYIPHYHAKEARDAIKPVLGEFYKIDRTPIFKAMWREAKECIYIEPDEGSKHEGVYWYHKM